MILGQVLKGARLAKGLKLNDLAEKVGVTAGYISQIEKGERNGTLDLAAKLAQVLGIPLDALVDLPKKESQDNREE